MLPTLLLGLVAGYAPKEVSLVDLKRYEIADIQLRERMKAGFQFREFASDTKLRGLSAAEMCSGFIHNQLLRARDTTDGLQSRLACLRGLRRKLGDADYYAGRLPPPCPPRFKRAFEQWQKNFDVSLQDLPRFGITVAEVRGRYIVFRQFLEFRAAGRTDPKTIWEDLKSGNVYSALGGALDTSESDKSRRMYLISLQRELGKKDYAAGKLPPPCPAKYQDIFERWLKDPKAWRKNGDIRGEPT